MRLREGAEGRLGSDWPIKAAPGSNQFAISCGQFDQISHQSCVTAGGRHLLVASMTLWHVTHALTQSSMQIVWHVWQSTCSLCSMEQHSMLAIR